MCRVAAPLRVASSWFGRRAARRGAARRGAAPRGATSRVAACHTSRARTLYFIALLVPLAARPATSFITKSRSLKLQNKNWVALISRRPHTSSTRTIRDQKSQRKCSPSIAARSRAQAASGCRRALATAIHGGISLTIYSLAGVRGIGARLRDSRGSRGSRGAPLPTRGLEARLG